MDGIGVNANSNLTWNNGELAPALDLLTDTANNQVWRVIVEPKSGWEDTNDNADPNTFNWTFYNNIYNTAKFQSLWGILGYLKQKNVNKIMVNVMGPAPDWMGGGGTLSTSQEDEWVEMIASMLIYAVNTKGLRIDIISPMNEEDQCAGVEGPCENATAYTRIAGKLAAEMNANGLSNIEKAPTRQIPTMV